MAAASIVMKVNKNVVFIEKLLIFTDSKMIPLEINGILKEYVSFFGNSKRAIPVLKEEINT